MSETQAPYRVRNRKFGSRLPSIIPSISVWGGPQGRPSYAGCPTSRASTANARSTPTRRRPTCCAGTCRERADEAQRDHRVREAAHDMLAALEAVERCACMDTSVMSPAAVMGICNRCKIVVREAIAKARGEEA